MILSQNFRTIFDIPSLTIISDPLKAEDGD